MLASVVIPATAFVFLAIVQVTAMVRSVANWIGHTDMSSLGDKTLRAVNEALAKVPFLHVTVTPESLRKGITAVAQHAGQWLLQVLQTAAGSVIGAVTASIIFLYVFVSLLTKREQVVTLIRRLNPLGEDITDVYLSKMGAMVRGRSKASS